MSSGADTTLWIRAFCDELARAGVHEVVVAPGSRSTPLVLAFDADDRFAVRVHLDERSAAFFALGVGKASGMPAVLVTTSGTATANAFPAVIEAAQSEAPLLVLTADRPHHLRDSDANQAIDQLEGVLGHGPVLTGDDPLLEQEAHDLLNSNRELADLEDGEEVLIGGMISSIKKVATKKPSRNGHSRYANFDFEDSTGIVRCIIWPEDYARSEDKVVQEAVCIIRGRVDRRGREPNVIVNQLLTLEEAEKQFTQHLVVDFRRGFHSQSDIRQTKDALSRFPGKTSVYLAVHTVDDENPGGGLRFMLQPPQDLKVTCNAELTDELTRIVGRENFRFHANVKKKSGASAGSTGR